MRQSDNPYPFIQSPPTESDLHLWPRLVYVLDENRTARIDTVSTLRNSHFAPYPYAAAQDLLDDLPALAPGCILVGALGTDFGLRDLFTTVGARLARHPVVVSVRQGDVKGAVQAIKQGASDVIERGADPVSLLAVLDPVLTTLEWNFRESAAYAAASNLLSVLSPREYDILSGLVEGLSSKQIATLVGLNARTVELSRSKMMKRLRAKTLSDALNIAFRANVISLTQRRTAG